jgi:hypothetical protein
MEKTRGLKILGQVPLRLLAVLSHTICVYNVRVDFTILKKEKFLRQMYWLMEGNGPGPFSL